MSTELTLPAYQGSTVKLSLLDGGILGVPLHSLVPQPIRGHNMWDFPCHSFLVENVKLGKKVLFDLGMMKAWKEKLPPVCECDITCRREVFYA
jgi:hypothetical protein